MEEKIKELASNHNLKIKEIKDIYDNEKPLFISYYVIDVDKNEFSYHGTIHKEGDNSIHVQAQNGIRKKTKIRIGWWNKDWTCNNQKYYHELRPGLEFMIEVAKKLYTDIVIPKIPEGCNTITGGRTRKNNRKTRKTNRKTNRKTKKTNRKTTRKTNRKTNRNP